MYNNITMNKQEKQYKKLKNPLLKLNKTRKNYPRYANNRKEKHNNNVYIDTKVTELKEDNRKISCKIFTKKKAFPALEIV